MNRIRYAGLGAGGRRGARRGPLAPAFPARRPRGVYLIDARTMTVREHLTRAHGLWSNLAMAAHLTADPFYVVHENGDLG